MNGNASPGKVHQAKGRDWESMNKSKSQIHQKDSHDDIDVVVEAVGAVEHELA